MILTHSVVCCLLLINWIDRSVSPNGRRRCRRCCIYYINVVTVTVVVVCHLVTTTTWEVIILPSQLRISYQVPIISYHIITIYLTFCAAFLIVCNINKDIQPINQSTNPLLVLRCLPIILLQTPTNDILLCDCAALLLIRS
jgi:quinol-cytochrome oxidoreductase complex cytochrome b subunit